MRESLRKVMKLPDETKVFPSTLNPQPLILHPTFNASLKS